MALEGNIRRYIRLAQMHSPTRAGLIPGAGAEILCTPQRCGVAHVWIMLDAGPEKSTV